MHEYLLFIFLFSFGAIIGSFLNVCIYRIPHLKDLKHSSTQRHPLPHPPPLEGEGRGGGVVTPLKVLSLISNLSFPPSHCPSCDEPIAFYDNIPIISYIILRGRCRSCRAKISIQYPIVELASGVFLGLLFYRFGWSMELPIYFAFLSALLVITVIDLKHRIIPDEISLSFILLGLFLAPISPITFFDSFTGVILGGGILLLIAVTYHYITKVEGMGGGDIKLLAMIGAFLGWKGVVFSLFSGSFFGAITGLSLILLKGKGLKEAVPFGPFLSLGAFLYIFWGDSLVRWYLG